MKVGLDVWFDPDRVAEIEHENLTLHREIYAWWYRLWAAERRELLQAS